VTIPSSVKNDLAELQKTRGDGYLFTNGNRTDRPLFRYQVYREFFKALERIGIDDERRRARHLSMHGFRHFFNTYLLAGNVNDSKVMALTGHTSEEMKKRYTHFDPTSFAEVLELQEKLLAKKPPAPPEKLPPNVTVFPVPEIETEEREPIVVTADDVRAAVSE